MANISELIRLSKMINAADDITSDMAANIADQVVTGYDEDNKSRADWLKRTEKAMNAALQVQENKTFPWSNSSNVKYPAMTVAALQFQARAYPAIIKDSNLVKSQVIGEDADGQKQAQGDRVAAHMNYQLLDQMPEWEDQFDKITLALPIEGCEFKKEFFDKSKQRLVSEWIRPKDFVVNYFTKTLEDCPRKTHVIERYPHQILEKQADGIYSTHESLIDTDDDNNEAAQVLLEQHLLYDVDGDGVKEPWIAVVHKDSKKLLRLVSGYQLDKIRVKIGTQITTVQEIVQKFQGFPEELEEMTEVLGIARENWFTKFSFIPSPDGGFYDLGFGHLIGPLMDTIDTTINQLIDAGTLANIPSGFYDKSMRGPKGNLRFKIGEWKPVDTPMGSRLSDAILPLPVKEPSGVLFNLLDLLLGSVKDITGVKDILTGDMPTNTQATTALAVIEQGLQVYSSIYKRIYRCLKAEFKVVKRLNAIFLRPQEYYRVLEDGSQGVVTLKDYQNDGTDVIPVADPTASTKMQEMAKSQVLAQYIQDPQFNATEIKRRMLEAAGISTGLKPGPLMHEEPPKPAPNPLMIAQVENLNADSFNKMASGQKNLASIEKTLVEVDQVIAKTIESLAETESKEAGVQLGIYKQQLDEIREHNQQSMANAQKGVMNEPGRVIGMEEPAGNQVVSPAGGGLEEGAGG